MLLLLLLLPFYGPLSGNTPGGPVPDETRKEENRSHLKSSISVAGGPSSIWILRGVGKIIEASAPTVRLDSIPPGPSMPPVLRRMPFLPKPNLSWLGTGTKYAGLRT